MFSRVGITGWIQPQPREWHEEEQQLHMPKAGSHPHAKDKIRRTNGAHYFDCVAVYCDVVDYRSEADFYRGARYDLIDDDVSTASIIVSPTKQKTVLRFRRQSLPDLAPARNLPGRNQLVVQVAESTFHPHRARQVLPSSNASS